MIYTPISDKYSSSCMICSALRYLCCLPCILTLQLWRRDILKSRFQTEALFPLCMSCSKKKFHFLLIWFFLAEVYISKSPQVVDIDNDVWLGQSQNNWWLSWVCSEILDSVSWFSSHVYIIEFESNKIILKLVFSI